MFASASLDRKSTEVPQTASSNPGVSRGQSASQRVGREPRSGPPAKAESEQPGTLPGGDRQLWDLSLQRLTGKQAQEGEALSPCRWMTWLLAPPSLRDMSQQADPRKGTVPLSKAKVTWEFLIPSHVITRCKCYYI